MKKRKTIYHLVVDKSGSMSDCIDDGHVVFCTVILGLTLTVSGFAKLAILTTKLHTKHQTSNIAEIVIRSTKPPILQNPC